MARTTSNPSQSLEIGDGSSESFIHGKKTHMLPGSITTIRLEILKDGGGRNTGKLWVFSLADERKLTSNCKNGGRELFEDVN